MRAAGRKWICQIIQERSLDQVSPYFFDGVVSLIYNKLLGAEMD